VETGLALIGEEGRRLLAFLPLFPAGNFILEAMQATCAAAERAAVTDPPTVTILTASWRRLISLLGRRPFRMSSPVKREHEPNEEIVDSAIEMPAWVAEGTRQLELGGFLDRDQEKNLYTFHQTLLDYAKRATSISPEQSSAGFLGLLVFYANYLMDNSRNYAAIDRCLDNALIAMDKAWAFRMQPAPLDALLAGMVDSLGSIFDLRGLWQLGDRWNERAIWLRRESEFARDLTALPHALYRRAGLVRNRGHYEKAKQLYRESFQLNDNPAHQQGRAAALHQLAVIEFTQGNVNEARQLLEQSMGISKSVGDVAGEAASLNKLGVIELTQGNLVDAFGFLNRTLNLTEACDKRGHAAALHELARVEMARGNVVEARQLLARSRGIFEELGDLRSRAASVHQLAFLESEQDNRALARRLFLECLSIFEGLGDLQAQATSLHELARIESAWGNLATALSLLSRSRDIFEGFGDLRGQGKSYHEMAIIKRAEGNRVEARQLWEHSIVLKDRVGDVDGMGATLGMLAQLEAEEGKLETALAMARESARLFEGGGNAMAAAARKLVAEFEALAAARTAKGNTGDAPECAPDKNEDESESTDHVSER
jgi:tetratricopeptide (TPR) repeat protein